MAQAITLTLTSVIPQIIEALPQQAALYNQQFLQRVLDYAIQNAPRSQKSETGYVHMADTQRLDLSNPDKPQITVDKEYAPFVHFGTYKMVGRPWLQWSVDRVTSDYQNSLSQIAQALPSL